MDVEKVKKEFNLDGLSLVQRENDVTILLEKSGLTKVFKMSKNSYKEIEQSEFFAECILRDCALKFMRDNYADLSTQ